MFAVIAADQAQVIGVAIGAGFGRECIGQVEVGVESPDGRPAEGTKSDLRAHALLVLAGIQGHESGFAVLATRQSETRTAVPHNTAS